MVSSRLRRLARAMSWLSTSFADVRRKWPVVHVEQQPAARRQCAQATERAAKATKQRAERLMPGAQQCEHKPRAKGRQRA